MRSALSFRSELSAVVPPIRRNRLLHFEEPSAAALTHPRRIGPIDVKNVERGTNDDPL